MEEEHLAWIADCRRHASVKVEYDARRGSTVGGLRGGRSLKLSRRIETTPPFSVLFHSLCCWRRSWSGLH